MTTVYISPLDDTAKKRLLKAVAARGQANGLEAAAVVMSKMAEGSMRVVGTNAIRDAAQAIRDKAAAIRKEADAEIAALEATCN